MIVSLYEFFQILFTIVVLGYIFMDFFPQKKFYISVLVVSPAIVLHELAHKFFGIYFGFDALYNVSYFGLAIGVALKLLKSPLIFFIPAFVTISGNGDSIGGLIIPLVGPLMNLVLFVIADLLCRYKLVDKKLFTVAYASRFINLWLFFLNMLPIPGTDGSHVYNYILSRL